jgi:hypothetical protein
MVRAGAACRMCQGFRKGGAENRHGVCSPQKKRSAHQGRFVFFLAERVGFEPTVRLHVRLISSQVHSTTLPPLRKGARGQREPAILRGAGNPDKRSRRAFAHQPAFFFASRNQVSTTVSGLSDTDSMP